MADNFIETPAEPTSDRNQLLAAIVLGLAAVLTALSSYMGGAASGDAAASRADAANSLADANFFYGQANQIFAADQTLFVEYASAAQEGNAELADYLTTLMRPELQDAVTWWQETDEAVTPFDDIEGNPYALADNDEAKQLEDQANAHQQEALDADEEGDTFDLATVFLALTLFFAGVATLFSRGVVTVGLLAMAAITLVAGATIFLTAL